MQNIVTLKQLIFDTVRINTTPVMPLVLTELVETVQKVNHKFDMHNYVFRNNRVLVKYCFLINSNVKVKFYFRYQHVVE
jgi:hypothetical protein